jgi:AsmA-like C-terminal region/Protein of unknown function/Domain of Unknown Function (DUF748)
MPKTIKLLSVVFFSLALFFTVVALAFYHVLRVGEWREFVLGELEARTLLKIQVGEADLEWGRILGIGFRGFALFEPGTSAPAIEAERVSARVALLPLLQRRVVLYGVRLYKPTARIVRAPDGHIPLLDRLFDLSFLRQETSPFDLDLRSISIQDGEAELEEEHPDGGFRRTRFRNVYLDLATIRDQKWPSVLKETANLKQTAPHGTALDFDLRSTVVNENENTTLRARGKVAFPPETFEFHNAWWNMQLQLGNLGAGLVQSYLGDRWRVKLMSGVFAPRLHVEGNANEQLRLRGIVSFKKLTAEIPDSLAAPFAPGDGQVEFDVAWEPQRLEISLFDFRSSELALKGRGEIRSAAGADRFVQLNLSAPRLGLVMLRKYLPPKLLDASLLEPFVSAVRGGELELKKIAIHGTLSEIRNVTRSATKGLFSFDGQLHGVILRPDSGGYLPLEELEGSIHLEKGVLNFNGLRAKYGQSRLTNLDGRYELALAGPGNLEVRGTGDIELRELREQMKLGVFPAPVTKLSSSIEELGGKGHVRFNLQRRGESAPDFQGQVNLDNARLRVDEISLTDIRGVVGLSPDEIHAEKLGALLSNSPVQIQLSLKNYAAEDGHFDLGVESTGVRAGIVSRLLLATGSPEDPGIVRGSMRYQGSFANTSDRKFTGILDLFGVKLDHPPLLQPVRELNGQVKFDEAGIDFQSLTGLLVGSPAEFSGRWRYTQKPQLVFNFAAPTLDIAYLLSQIDPESTEWYETLTAQGKVSLVKGHLKSFEFAELKTELNLDRRVWRLENLAMRTAGGTVHGIATIVDKPDSLGFSMRPKIQGVPLQGMMNWFEAGQAEVTGKVNVAGNLESIGKDGTERKQNLNGALSLRIEDGTIHRLRLLVQILNLLDLSRWFTLKLPDLGKDGIRFRSISADFTVHEGVFSTQNLIVDSDDLRMTGSGRIDVAKDDIDFVLAVRPFAGIDTVIGYIPLIGRGFAAIKNSFLVASFNLRGPLEEPTITPAPLSTLSEVFFGVLGIPKNMIGLGDEEKRAGSQKDQKTEPAEEAATVLAR